MSTSVPRRVRFEDLCDALASHGSVLDVLPEDVSAALREAPAPLVMADFAGRDSVAAVMAWLEENEVGTVLPVADVVPTRYGDWSVYEDNWARMRDQVRRRFPSVLVAPWFVLEDVDMWRLLNGRYTGALVKAFGFFTPCLGCHLHFYAMRGVLANALGAVVLLSGEKEFHGRKRKANQTPEAVAAYAALSRDQGVDHRFPIHHVTAEAEMGRLLGDGWREGERQLSCVMSGNDQGLDGEPVMSAGQIKRYMSEFAVPVAALIVELRRAGVRGGDVQRQVDERVRALLAEVRA
jgi:hypothetical protein